MPSSNLEPHATVDHVNRYLHAYHLAVEEVALGVEWSESLENLAESVRCLYRSSEGRRLLNHWSFDEADIHQYIRQLWDQFMTHQNDIHLISNAYFRRCVWEFTLGFLLVAVPPTIFIFILPLLSTPAVLISVFLLTCVILPIVSHFLLINPAIKDRNASQSLENTLKNDALLVGGIGLSRQAFFQQSALEPLREAIATHFNSPAI